MGRILLVDDSSAVRATLGPLAKIQGHTVVAVGGGQEAIEALDAGEPFDVLVTDLRMAPMDGIELIIRALKKYPTLDVVVVSAYATPKAMQTAQELGCAAFVKKPYNIDEVLALLEAIFERRAKQGPPQRTWGDDDWVV